MRNRRRFFNLAVVLMMVALFVLLSQWMGFRTEADRDSGGNSIARSALAALNADRFQNNQLAVWNRIQQRESSKLKSEPIAEDRLSRFDEFATVEEKNFCIDSFLERPDPLSSFFATRSEFLSSSEFRILENLHRREFYQAREDDPTVIRFYSALKMIGMIEQTGPQDAVKLDPVRALELLRSLQAEQPENGAFWLYSSVAADLLNEDPLPDFNQFLMTKNFNDWNTWIMRTTELQGLSSPYNYLTAVGGASGVMPDYIAIGKWMERQAHRLNLKQRSQLEARLKKIVAQLDRELEDTNQRLGPIVGFVSYSNQLALLTQHREDTKPSKRFTETAVYRKGAEIVDMLPEDIRSDDCRPKRYLETYKRVVEQVKANQLGLNDP